MAPPLVRLSVLQLTSYGAMGAVFPFLALELRHQGVKGLWLTIALTSIPLVRIVLGPSWGVLADRIGRVRPALQAAGALTLLGTVSLALGWGPWLALPGALVLASGRSGVGPLSEAATLQAVDRDMGRYGNVRRWGSIGFLSVVLGVSLAHDAWGVAPLWVGAALGLGLIAATISLPRTDPPPPSPLGPALRALAKDPVLVVLLAAAALHFAGITLYDGFFAVHLEHLGHGTSWVGVAIALGVGTEVVVLSFSGWLLRRVGARPLLVLAMLLNVPRWLLTAWLTEPWMVVPIQAVHGFTFGAFWIAAVSLASERSPERLTGSVQGLLAASIGGVGAAMGNAIGSRIVEGQSTSDLYLVAAGLATAATLLAVWVARASRP